MGFYSANSLKQQSAGRDVAPLERNYPLFAPLPYCYVVSRETATYQFHMCLMWTYQRLKADHANYYTTDAVHSYVFSRRNCNGFQQNAQ
jgi:hypothetical protein